VRQICAKKKKTTKNKTVYLTIQNIMDVKWMSLWMFLSFWHIVTTSRQRHFNVMPAGKLKKKKKTHIPIWIVDNKHVYCLVCEHQQRIINSCFVISNTVTLKHNERERLLLVQELLYKICWLR